MKQKRATPTHAEIAKAIGVSTRRVTQLKGEGMPMDSVEAAMAWRDEIAGSADSAEQLRLERIKLVREQRTAKEIDNAKARRELVPIGEVIADIGTVVSAARGELLKLSADLPPRLDGLSPPRMQVVIREAIIDVLTRLSDETSSLYQCPDQ